MKRIVLKTILIFIVCSYNVQSQALRFGDTKKSNLGVLLDPYASWKKKGVNIGAEIDYRENGLYIHTGLQTFSVIKGGYTDWITGIGTNLNIGYFDNFQLYTGGRLGLIFRGGQTYPTVGAEIGTDYIFLNGISIGIRSTYDYRSDFEFWGGSPEMRFNTFLKLGFKI